MRIAVLLSVLGSLPSLAQSGPRFTLSAEDVFREYLDLSQPACDQRFPPTQTPAPAPSGDLYFCRGQFDLALTAYQASPNNAPRIALTRLAQQRSADALATSLAPVLAVSLRASLLLEQERPAGLPAIQKDLTAALAKDPDNHLLLTTIGRALLATGDTRTAQLSIDQALRLQPAFVPALAARAALELLTSQYSTSAATSAEILRLRPAHSFARALQASAYMQQGRLDEAGLLLAETLRLYPANHDARYQLGLVRLRLGNPAEAEKLFEEVLAASPKDHRGLLALTEVYSARKEFDRALKRLDDAIQKEPENKDLRAAWANIAIRAGRLDAGAAVYRKLVDTNPNDFNLRMSFAEIFRQKGDWGQAADQWKAAAALRPNEISPALNQALALEQTGRIAEAAPIYERILRIDSNQVIALNNYSNFLASEGKDLDAALRYALRAAIISAGDPMISDTLGYVYLKRKEPKEAVKIFERLAADQPAQPLFHIRYAQSLRMAGDAPGAKRECDLARPLLNPATQKEFAAHCPAAQ